MPNDTNARGFAAALGAATQLFEGNRAQAEAQLEEPSSAMGGISPHAAVDAGRGPEVIDLIHRIEHGVLP